MDANQASKSPHRLKIRLTSVILLFVLLGMMVLKPAQAHIVPEEPWHPAPAAYLRALFYANLTPIDWDQIADEYATVIEQDYIGVYDSVYQTLEPASTVEGIDHAAAIRQAINSQDRAALYRASTHAISQLIRYHLGEAQANLDQPGRATEEVQRAQQIYRAFQDFIRQTDPEATQQLGVAWLDISSSVGSAGISGAGSVASNPEKFTAAREEIETYLVENYETDDIPARTKLAPIPATQMDADVNIETWLPPGSNLVDQQPLPLLALNFEERGIEESDLPLVAYGDMLFDSPAIMGDPARSLNISCATCHNRSDINKDFFIPGVSHQAGAADVDGSFFNPLFNDRRSDSLDIPSLRGIRFTAPYGRDGRFSSLREFSRNAIVNEFGGEEPTPFMLDALVTYMLEFDWQPNSMLDSDGTLNQNASEAALRGEELFSQPFEGMNGQACSSCHIPSANFVDGRAHDIGSGNPATEFARDSAFDTPTLINVAQTAPYFHDGSLATLAHVVDWFDANFDLGLSTQEKSDLTAYVEAVGAADTPWEVFDEENTRFALDWAELSTFLSTLDTLIEQEDQYHAILLLETVTPDLRLDASAATDREVIPQVYEIADKLDEIQVAIEAGNWTLAAELNEEYKTMAETYGPNFK